ncbi:hypothetical protein L596_017250 [Steinernema carpocapsae]|uniref:Arrestin C-terminal-like domain-containing protein n=1 Tax=Steinernema carpocapsae TaxID=34508 RepID=A0A4U5N143_STECR|nr:hypothetical protein L596_017250 [Steinernema carpocapsae]
MTILVVSKLERNVHIYMNGETVKATLELRNNDTKHSDTLAWGCVQLHCERVITQAGRRIQAQRKLSSTAEGGSGKNQTAMSQSADTVFSSRPTIVFCELRLNPGETKLFECSQDIPMSGIPPSYKGRFVKYLYKMTFAVQHLRSPIKLINIPIKVIASDILWNLQMPQRPKGGNPFLINRAPRPTITEIATETLDHLTAQRKAQVFGIKNAYGTVTSITLYKKAFKMGEDVIGRFVFDDCTVPCTQYTVSLQSVESTVEDDVPKSFVTTHAMTHEVCAYYDDAHFRLTIPLTSVPTFYTDMVHVKWRLHFEFVTSVQNPIKIEAEGLSHAEKRLDIETMSWDLGIKVFPCCPSNAALAPNTEIPRYSITV